MSKIVETYKFDAIIIGGGIVGLAIAHSLSKDFNNILIVDKESTFGQHISSRNSEVIHSGLYYEPGSLKAKLCFDGNHMMYDFCDSHSIPYNNCGKLIIAHYESEIIKLQKLLSYGHTNGLSNLYIITKDEIQKKEPLINCLAALSVPSSGIVDSHSVMKKLESLINARGSSIVYNMEVTDINKIDNMYRLSFSNINYHAESKIIINAAGLWSTSISNMLGITDYKIHYCKGDYYSTSLFKGKINSLIYPLPTKNSLGIHLVLKLDGSIQFGPNAYYTNELDYTITENHKDIFLNHINQFLKIDKNSLRPDFSGLRPKLQGPNDTSKDFIIINEYAKGYKNFINLIGIDSPGLTSCLAIGEYVRGLLILD